VAFCPPLLTSFRSMRAEGFSVRRIHAFRRSTGGTPLPLLSKPLGVSLGVSLTALTLLSACDADCKRPKHRARVPREN
jgi:hypothetical protein